MAMTKMYHFLYSWLNRHIILYIIYIIFAKRISIDDDDRVLGVSYNLQCIRAHSHGA